MIAPTKHLLASLCLGLGLSAMAIGPAIADTLDNQTIKFDQDTIVEFEFLQSHGAYQSAFGVMNMATGEKTPLLSEVKSDDADLSTSSRQNDFIGTPGNTVPQPLAEFTFKANTPYTLYLQSTLKGKDAGTVFSANELNKGKNQQVRFGGGFANLADGQGVMTNWDDTGSLLVKSNKDDMDFNDFTVAIGGYKPCRPAADVVVPTP